MKKVFPLLLVTLLAASCDFVTYNGDINGKYVYVKGPSVTDTLDLKDFHSICINGQADVDYVQADEFFVQLTAPEGILEYMDCHVEDGCLILQNKESIKLRSEKLCFLVKAPVIESVDVNGAADLDMSAYTADKDFCLTVHGAGDLDVDSICVPAIKVELYGAGDIDMDGIQTDKLTISVYGAGDAKLSGYAKDALLEISGAGDIDARNLKTDTWNQRKNGVGRIRL